MRSHPDAILVSTWLHVGTKKRSKSHRGGVLGRLGCVLGRFGRVFGRLGVGLGPSWGILDASWKRLGRLWGVLGAFWGVLGAAASNDETRRGRQRDPRLPGWPISKDNLTKRPALRRSDTPWASGPANFQKQALPARRCRESLRERNWGV